MENAYHEISTVSHRALKAEVRKRFSQLGGEESCGFRYLAWVLRHR